MQYPSIQMRHLCGFRPHRNLFITAAIGLLVFGSVTSVSAEENWTRFRGPNGTGISDLKGLPTEWTDSDYEWSVTLDGKGHSSPVIYGDTLFVTSGFDDGRRSLICLDALTGQKKWDRTIKLDPNHLHKKNSYCSSSPTTDGELVYTAEADQQHFLIHAYTMTGKEVWKRDLGPFVSQHGFGPSPMLYQEQLIIPYDQDGSAEIVSLDAKTGETIWTSTRKANTASYATPMILNLNGQDLLIVLSGATGIAGLNPLSGEQLWESGKLPERTVASPVYGNGLLLATCGSGGRGKFMVAVDPRAPGENRPAVKAERKKMLPYVPTPIVHDQYVYFWNDDGTVCCLDMHGDFTEEVWRERVGGNYSSSPILVDGKIYCVSEEGDVKVIDASPDFKQHKGGKLGDDSYSTPAIANGRMYLKGFGRLVSLKAKAPTVTKN